jgi:hypothetical protein
MDFARTSRPRPRALAASLAALLVTPLPAFGAGSLIISELRLGGPAGPNDEFIEIYNDSGAAHTVAAVSGTGYAVAASDGVVRCTIANGTVIPARARFLCTGSTYSLADYAGTGAAAGNAVMSSGIPDNAGVALFNNTTGGASFSLANRLDAVGSTSEGNALYREGAGYPALASTSSSHSLVRDECGKGGALHVLGPCTTSTPKDTGDNAADFYFVSNDVSVTGVRLGAPGPQRSTSPITGGSVANLPLDATVDTYAVPNKLREFTSDPGNNSTAGTISFRRRIKNNTGVNVTRLRFRLVDVDTFPAAGGFADLRLRTSNSVSVSSVNDPGTCAASGFSTPCTVTVQGTTLEQPPVQASGGGFNSSVSAGTITLGTPIAPGASLNLQFLFGIQQTGSFRLTLRLEGLPQGGGSLYLQCSTEGCTDPCFGKPTGDANGDGAVSVLDVFHLINDLFAGGPPPVCFADVNRDGADSVLDVFYLISYLFAGGPAPIPPAANADP